MSAPSRRHALGWIGTGLGLGLWAPRGMAQPGRASDLLEPFHAQGVLTQGGWLRGVAPAGTRVLTYQPAAPVAPPGAQGVPQLLPAPQDVGLAPDGAFFLAFDRDAGSGAQLTAQTAQGRSLTRTLAISPREWQIEQIDAPFHPPAMPDAEFAARRAPEMAQIKAARAVVSDAQGWRQAFQWPAQGRISGRFGSQRIYRGTPGSYHSGLDIAAGAGNPYHAPADGVVVLAAEAPFTLEGHLLMVDHGMGLNSAFLHADSLLVKLGDRVRQGQPLGIVGMTGRATGPHLHWSLTWHESRLDPLLFLPPVPMPVSGG